MFTISKLNHHFNPIIYNNIYQHRLICYNCGMICFIKTDDSFIKKFFISVYWDKVDEFDRFDELNISCEEIIIKNLLE